MRFILLPAFLDFHLLVSIKYPVVGTSNRFGAQEIYLEINRSMTDTISLLISGSESNEWVLIDAGDVLVNIMTEDSRDHYDLESLWNRSRK